MISQPQFNQMADTTKIGAMPIKPKFDGPAPIKPPAGSMSVQPNESISIPKPGFF